MLGYFKMWALCHESDGLEASEIGMKLNNFLTICFLIVK